MGFPIRPWFDQVDKLGVTAPTDPKGHGFESWYMHQFV